MSHHLFMEFVNEIYITAAGVDLMILSQSETLGSGAFFAVQAPVTWQPFETKDTSAQ